MMLCERCREEVPEPKMTRAIIGSIIISELEQAINRTPERREALIDAKVENARSTLRMLWEQWDTTR